MWESDKEALALVGRDGLDLDKHAIDRLGARGRILITGAGGSIGSHLARSLRGAGARDLVLLDRDESALHALELALSGTGDEVDDRFVLADITRGPALASVLSKWKPDVVIHTAALKHLPLLERFPGEAWQVNVAGTLAVCEAAEAAGVRTLVNLSTDKAAAPGSVLGRTKYLGERIVAHHGPGWVSVRLANVLGTRGSVTETFERQLRSGGPLTVTHREVTRYFLTPLEASRLLAVAAALASEGGTLVARVPGQRRIADLAAALSAASGRPAQISFTGLRPGEKLEEDLVGPDEQARLVHPAMWRVDVPGIEAGELSCWRDWVASGERPGV